MECASVILKEAKSEEKYFKHGPSDNWELNSC